MEETPALVVFVKLLLRLERILLAQLLSRSLILSISSVLRTFLGLWFSLLFVFFFGLLTLLIRNCSLGDVGEILIEEYLIPENITLEITYAQNANNAPIAFGFFFLFSFFFFSFFLFFFFLFFFFLFFSFFFFLFSFFFFLFSFFFSLFFLFSFFLFLS